jgi:hypothetical protein
MTTCFATASSPTRTDVEAHLDVLELFMKAFPKRAPSELNCVKGLCALDNFYRMKLSKECKVKHQMSWAITDVTALWFSCCQ